MQSGSVSYTHLRAHETVLECSQDEVIDFKNKAMMVSIVKAMAMFENGINVEQTPIVEGYEMACLA